MKILKLIGIPILTIALFLSCKKTDNNALSVATENGVTLKNGVVTFKTTADYLAAIDNKTDKQQKLFTLLKENNFKALRDKQMNPGIKNTGTTINTFTTAFDTALYTKYLLDVLNNQKICSIDGYLVKVDMDNGFCSVLDETLYPSETSDLVDNVFSNTHIMSFVNADEPVLEVLTRMRNNTLTWAQYQDSLAAKGGQGICFKSGASSAYSATSRYVSVNGLTLRIFSEAKYTRAFISFELVGLGYANGDGISDNVTLNGRYEYVGACSGSGNAVINIPTFGWIYRFQVYSGGSALKVRKLEITTTARRYGIGYMATIGY